MCFKTSWLTELAFLDLGYLGSCVVFKSFTARFMLGGTHKAEASQPPFIRYHINKTTA